VPLKAEYDEDVPEDCRFYPEMIFTVAKAWRKKIGLWIDLTNTSRYYDKEVVEESDCTYLKLACKGRGECPSAEVVATFVQVGGFRVSLQLFIRSRSSIASSPRIR